METMALRAQELLGITLSESAAVKMQEFASFLLASNEQQNLTAITHPADVATKHFLDSLSLINALHKDAHTIVDIGAGAGFPGIPVAIARPDLSLTLLDASEKKVLFLESAIAKLGLTNVRARHLRAEDAGQNEAYREQFDVAVARAVAYLPILAEYALPLVRVGGQFIAQKTATAEEIADADAAITLLGGKHNKLHPIHLPNLEERHLIVIDKISPTPKLYPRRAGVPERKPLSQN